MGRATECTERYLEISWFYCVVEQRALNMKTLRKRRRLRDHIPKSETRGKATGALRDFKSDFLAVNLQDLDTAAGYLSAAIEEGEDVFLLAVRDVVEAQGGIGKLAQKTKLNRENLYAMLSRRGNPRLSSLVPVLGCLGFEITLRKRTKARAA